MKQKGEKLNQIDMKPSSTPEEFSTLSPHLMVDSIEEQIDFLKEIFDASILDEFRAKSGKIIHATLKVGETTIMIGLSRGDFPAITSMNYIFVDDADKIYRRALEFGATSVIAPEDQFFGHRQGAVKDSQGNIWWIAKFLRKVSPEELSKFMPE